jgi:hypothetical protein
MTTLVDARFGQAARPCRCQPFSLVRLGGFRAELYACFPRRADALVELGDALLCAPRSRRCST